MLRLSENGEVVLVTEQLVCDGQNQRQRIILRVNIRHVDLWLFHALPVDMKLQKSAKGC